MQGPFQILGMHGMGDNLHMRAIVRQIMEKHSPVYLTTSWFSLYHDLVTQGLHVIEKQTPLRTQTKNAVRERKFFWKGFVPRNVPTRQVAYSPDAVRKNGSVLHAMIATFGLDVTKDDFRLPVPQAWLDKIDALIRQWKPTKPIMVYRPLVLRREWHFDGRNPDYNAYATVFEKIRDKYFVVSIADLVPKEKSKMQWEVIVSRPVNANIEYHNGELPFEMLAALFKRTALVYCSPGFSVPLAQAVGTPVACMFGGYENSSSFSHGAKFAPYLGMDVIRPCVCFSHQHNCDRSIDVAKSIEKMMGFIDAVADYYKIPDTVRTVEIPEPALSESGRIGSFVVAGQFDKTESDARVGGQ